MFNLPVLQVVADGSDDQFLQIAVDLRLNLQLRTQRLYVFLQSLVLFPDIFLRSRVVFERRSGFASVTSTVATRTTHRVQSPILLAKSKDLHAQRFRRRSLERLVDGGGRIVVEGQFA